MRQREIGHQQSYELGLNDSNIEIPNTDDQSGLESSQDVLNQNDQLVDSHNTEVEVQRTMLPLPCFTITLAAD